MKKLTAMKIDQSNIIKETEKAICVDIGCGGSWLPKSQIEVVNNIILMPFWLAKQKFPRYSYDGHNMIWDTINDEIETDIRNGNIN